jgi:ATP-dependent Lon protease
VGGIKEKVLAAMRAGIRRVLLPERNRKDLEEVPAEAKQKIEFVFLRDVDEAVRAVLEPRAVSKSRPHKRAAR